MNALRVHTNVRESQPGTCGDRKCGPFGKIPVLKIRSPFQMDSRSELIQCAMIGPPDPSFAISLRAVAKGTLFVSGGTFIKKSSNLRDQASLLFTYEEISSFLKNSSMMNMRVSYRCRGACTSVPLRRFPRYS